MDFLYSGSMIMASSTFQLKYYDVIKWKHFPRYWLFVRGIRRSPVNSPYKGQWRGALMFSLISIWISGWVNNHEAGDLRRYRVHYDVSVMRAQSSYDLSMYVPQVLEWRQKVGLKQTVFGDKGEISSRRSFVLKHGRLCKKWIIGE